MAMEWARSSLLATLLFLELVVLTVAASGGNDAAAAVEVEEHPPADEPYMLVAFHNKAGEEMRLLSDKGTETLSASGFANRSGHWFYTIRDGKGGNKQRRRRRRRLPQSNNTPASLGSRGTEGVEGFWNTLGALANTTAANVDPADDERYMLVGMQTSGGDKIRLVVVADQRYFFITGNAKGFRSCPRWFFRDDGQRHRLPSLGGNGSSSSHGDSSGSHAEVVASNVVAALIRDGLARQARSSSVSM